MSRTASVIPRASCSTTIPPRAGPTGSATVRRRALPSTRGTVSVQVSLIVDPRYTQPTPPARRTDESARCPRQAWHDLAGCVVSGGPVVPPVDLRLAPLPYYLLISALL